MKPRRVELSDEAMSDLIELFDWIASTAGSMIAVSYLERLEAYCRGLSLASERGYCRDDVRPGLRIVGFEKRVTVAFAVEGERVVVLRFFYGGQNWEDRFDS